MYFEEIFDRSRVMHNVEDINDKIRDEKAKMSDEQDKEKLLKLYQKQLMEGMKLNIGTRMF